MSKDLTTTEPDTIELPNEFMDADELDKFAKEYNLFRIEGFCFDFNRRRKGKGKITKPDKFSVSISTPEGQQQADYKISYDSEYGKPGVLGFKLYHAIIKKLLDYKQPYPMGVPFGARELARAIGRKKPGGKAYKDIHRELKAIRKTSINGKFYVKYTKKQIEKKGVKGRWIEADFNLIDALLSAGEIDKDGDDVASQFYIYPSSYIIQNISNNYALWLNHSRMAEISDPIDTILFYRLYSAFSYQYSKLKSKNIVFIKDYADICNVWFGGLVVNKYKSDIDKQFKSHFKKLKDIGYLAKLPQIKKNKRGTGYNIFFLPGKAFFEDLEKLSNEDGVQLSLPIKQKKDEIAYQLPMEIARYFKEKLSGKSDLADKMLSQTDVNIASKLLKEFSADDLKSWIDFALKEAPKTNFNIQTLGGIKTYKERFFNEQEELKKNEETRKKKQTQEAKKAAKEKQKENYNAFIKKIAEVERKKYSEEDISEFEKMIREFYIKEKNLAPQFIFSAMIKNDLNIKLAEEVKAPSLKKWIALGEPSYEEWTK